MLFLILAQEDTVMMTISPCLPVRMVALELESCKFDVLLQCVCKDVMRLMAESSSPVDVLSLLMNDHGCSTMLEMRHDVGDPIHTLSQATTEDRK